MHPVYKNKSCNGQHCHETSQCHKVQITHCRIYSQYWGYQHTTKTGKVIACGSDCHEAKVLPMPTKCVSTHKQILNIALAQKCINRQESRKCCTMVWGIEEKILSSNCLAHLHGCRVSGHTRLAKMRPHPEVSDHINWWSKRLTWGECKSDDKEAPISPGLISTTKKGVADHVCVDHADMPWKEDVWNLWCCQCSEPWLPGCEWLVFMARILVLRAKYEISSYSVHSWQLDLNKTSFEPNIRTDITNGQHWTHWNISH